VFDLDFVAQALRISVPYVLAALGGMFSERGGVINIALEGILVVGAFGYVLGAHATGSPWVGLVVAVGLGLLLAFTEPDPEATDRLAWDWSFLDLGTRGFDLGRYDMSGILPCRCKMQYQT